LVIRLRRLARYGRIPILVVHHSRKGSTGGDQEGARGATALVNACRSVATLERMSDDEHKTIKPPQSKERYVRVTGAKANYAGRIGDRWLELEPVLLPNGDEAPGFKPVHFGKVDEGFDARTWEHREAFLEIVERGRGDGKPWSTAITGPAAPRLDATISNRLGLDAELARKVIARYEDAKLIERREIVGPDRHRKEIWSLSNTPLGEDAVPMAF
jgi:hypothetical protein